MFIKVKVFPKSKENKIVGRSKDSLDIYVKEKPKEGKANKAAMDTLSFHLKIPVKKLRLIKGARQKNKIFKI